MITGPSVGPGMLLTVLMRWPILIAVFTIWGGAYYGYKQYGLPDFVETTLSQTAKPVVKQISDSDKTKVIDHFAVAQNTAKAEEVITKVDKPLKITIESYTVKEGDSLSKIVAKRKLSSSAQKSLAAKILNDNPKAFRDSDANQLQANVVITINEN